MPWSRCSQVQASLQGHYISAVTCGPDIAIAIECARDSPPGSPSPPDSCLWQWGCCYSTNVPERTFVVVPALAPLPADVGPVASAAAGADHVVVATQRGEVLTWGMGGQWQAVRRCG